MIDAGRLESQKAKDFHRGASIQSILTRDSREKHVGVAIVRAEISRLAATGTGGTDVEVNDAIVIDVAGISGTREIGIIGSVQAGDLFVGPIDAVGLRSRLPGQDPEARTSCIDT